MLEKFLYLLCTLYLNHQIKNTKIFIFIKKYLNQCCSPYKIKQDLPLFDPLLLKKPPFYHNLNFKTSEIVGLPLYNEHRFSS